MSASGPAGRHARRELGTSGRSSVLDFYSIAANALWVLGLALILAALSWANWVAVRERIPFRRALGRPNVRRTVDGGLVLFCAGLAATGRTRWEQVLWSIFAVGFIALAIWEEGAIRRNRRSACPVQEADSNDRTQMDADER